MTKDKQHNHKNDEGGGIENIKLRSRVEMLCGMRGEQGAVEGKLGEFCLCKAALSRPS